MSVSGCASSPLVMVGWDFRHTPVALRERLAFSPEKVKDALAALREQGLLREGVILSTCNRSEVYGVAGDLLEGQDPTRALTAFVSRFHGVPASEVAGAGYGHTGLAAVRHLLRVAAGLESLALGEDQIIGQVREAYRLASGAGATRQVLHKLFQKALESGKRVRSETGLSARPISIPGVAMELTQKIFEDLSGRRFLILGAGETSGIYYDLLLARGARHVEVVNRTLARAERLCARGGEAFGWDRLAERLPSADVVISAVSTETPVVTAELAKEALRRRSGQPLFFLDLGIPRNVDPSIQALPGAFLYAVDDLQQIAERNRQARQSEVAGAMAILEEETEKFLDWFGALAVVPTVTALRERFEALRASEFDRRLDAMPNLSEADRLRLRGMAQAMVKHVLRLPTEALKAEADPGLRLARAEAVRHLFALEMVAP